MDWQTDDGINLPMINDAARNNFYLSSLKKVVQDKTIIDVGAGSGLLSVMAARLGAKKVWAIEKDIKRSHLAASIIEKIGLKDKIQVINNDFLNLSIKADYCVTETIGNPFNENILNIAKHARNNNLGIMIPSKFDLWVEAYSRHDIFSVCLNTKGHDRFNWDNEIMSDFNTEINRRIELNNNAFKADYMSNLFIIKDMLTTDLQQVYCSNKITVDLNSHYQPALEILVKGDEVQDKGDVMFVAFWRASFDEFSMDLKNAWWACPCKYIQHVKGDILVKYDLDKSEWWFNTQW